MVDDHEELLSNSVAKLERIRHKHERLSKILISVKAGVEHLQDKLKSTASEVRRRSHRTKQMCSVGLVLLSGKFHDMMFMSDQRRSSCS